jgi:hypothetical protein
VPTIKKKLTSRFVDGVKSAPAGTRLEIRDTEVRSFALRVTDRGAKSYILDLRWPGSKAPAKRTIGGKGTPWISGSGGTGWPASDLATRSGR